MEGNQEVDGRHFVFADYLVFGGMLLISTLIGVFFAIKDRLSSGAENFFTAEGKLGVLPVALSMLASFLSSITLLGQPAEAFLYGFQLVYFGISSFAVIPIVGYVFAPFFQRKKYLSAYDYFGERFSLRLQFIAALLFTIQMVLYLALVLYAPALAIHRVTGVNTILIVSIMYLVCIFYTTIGGMKAVVWTDSFQVIVLYVALFVILIKGTIDVGGISVVWKTNAAYNRTDIFNWSVDPTVRYSTWSAFIGSAFLHVTFYGGNQVQIQRYLTVSSPAQARKMLWINVIGWSLVVYLTVYAGLLIFAHYINCNPFTSQKVSIADELFPLYVMEMFHELPGFPGLFLAGIFSAGLSTVSAGINSLAALWINELRNLTQLENAWEKQSGSVAKILSIIFGILSFVLVFLVPYLGGLVPIAVSLSGIFTGSLFGVFLLGMFSTRANNTGAMSGLLCSIFILIWMAIGNVFFSSTSGSSYSKLNIPTDGCSQFPHSTTFTPLRNFTARPLQVSGLALYRVSFLWYPMLACVLTVIIGHTVSFISRRNKRSMTKSTPSKDNELKVIRVGGRTIEEMSTMEPFLTGDN